MVLLDLPSSVVLPPGYVGDWRFTFVATFTAKNGSKSKECFRLNTRLADTIFAG